MSWHHTTGKGLHIRHWQTSFSTRHHRSFTFGLNSSSYISLSVCLYFEVLLALSHCFFYSFPTPINTISLLKCIYYYYVLWSANFHFNNSLHRLMHGHLQLNNCYNLYFYAVLIQLPHLLSWYFHLQITILSISLKSCWKRWVLH